MEPDQRQSLANIWPLIAVVLIVSGILIRTVPLESKRPIDANRVRFYHAGRQDVEARLWQDPFVAVHQALHDDMARGPIARCEKAIDDLAHHPSTLGRLIAYRTRRSGREITVLPVMVRGGPYFEDGEGRRRSRYAVITALLNSGWSPSEADKLGFVWTFQSCVENPWERRVPELLPYEWFTHEGPPRRDLLVLWVDEDAITRGPVKGIERILEGIAKGDTPCPFFRDTSPGPGSSDYHERLREKIEEMCGLPKAAPGHTRDANARKVNLDRVGVIGPSTSSSLIGLAQELARELGPGHTTIGSYGDPPAMPSAKSATTLPQLRFYSSSATAQITDTDFLHPLYDYIQALDPPEPPNNSVKDLDRRDEVRERFETQVIRLTTTDKQLTDALINEVKQRLDDATPFSRISLFNPHGGPLCGDTVVVVSELDTIYARTFHKAFEAQFREYPHCPRETSQPNFHPAHYLRGLDGALPQGTATSTRFASPSDDQAPMTMDVVFDQTAPERADGNSQYDYLRRLATDLIDLDRREKEAGRNGVRAVGVLGNDVYDKILVLDALRDRFPKAVFFTHDLDARLLGREVIRSTRNLIVASSYGLTLNPGIQRGAPPFRDTYQSGMYLSTLIALDPDRQHLSNADFASWFKEPRLFEIGQTRAVPLSKGAEKPCERADPSFCKNIHALDEWTEFSLLPNHPHLIALLVVAATAATGLFFLPRVVRRVVIAETGMLVGVVLIVGVVVWWVIWPDIISGEGEPFAWFEGVSIWPTKGLELLTLLVTFTLLWYGRRQLNRNINSVAKEFSLTRLSERKSATTRRGKGKRGFWSYIRGCREPDQTVPDASGNGSAGGPWVEFLDQMQFRPTFCRVFMITALFFVFGIALLNLDWPFSPHRGSLSAWFNHALPLVLLAFMMALLCTVLDASERTSHYLPHLCPHTLTGSRGEEPTGQGVWTRYPVGEDTLRLWTRFRFAVRLASSVNWFIYLPFIPLLLVLPTRSRVLEAWNFPLPYVALLGISALLAVRGAFSLRRAASALRIQILKELDSQMEGLNLAQYNQSQQADATRALVATIEQRATPSGQANSGTRANSASAGQENGGGLAPDEISPQTRAALLRQIIDEIRSVQEGPFRPFTQEPVVRAILIVSGWVSGLSTVEFLFLR